MRSRPIQTLEILRPIIKPSTIQHGITTLRPPSQLAIPLPIYFSGDGAASCSTGITEMNAKRKRETDGPSVTADERKILDLIKSRKDIGIWSRDINKETKLAAPVVNKSLKSLLSKNLIKEVKNIQNKGKINYMAAEFEPSREISGGDWYVNGSLDIELITVLKQLCLRYIRSQQVATLAGVYNDMKNNRVVAFEISSQQVAEILNTMVLDNEIIEVKSTGLGAYHSIPLNTTCYRIASGVAAKGVKTGAFASIPCGACPRINICSPNGVISPSTCEYFTKWLEIEF